MAFLMNSEQILFLVSDHIRKVLFSKDENPCKDANAVIGSPDGIISRVEKADEIEGSLDSFEPPWVIQRDVLAVGRGYRTTSEKSQ